MIRASIGNAVIDIAAPMKSAASPTETFSANRAVSPWTPQAMSAPRLKGVRIPAHETVTALRARFLRSSTSKSRPTRNM